MSEATPSTPASNGRAPGGRFGPGNKAGKGNPHAKQVAALRGALLKAVKPSDITEIIATLLNMAKSGDIAAAKELLQRVLGPAESIDLLERLEVLEERITEITKESRL